MGMIVVMALVPTALGVFLIGIFFFYRKSLLKAERRHLEEQQFLMREHYQVLNQKRKLADQYREELGESTNILRQLLQEKSEQSEDMSENEEAILNGLKRELAAVESSISDSREIHYCENPVINGVFQHKIAECESKGIRTDIRISMPEDILPEIEMVGILYNLFDNAIEACQRMEGTKEKYLVIRCEQSNGQMSVLFENSKPSDMITKSGRKTWKRNQEKHGIGLEIIRDLVAKNGGRIAMKETPEIYRTEIVFGEG